MPFFTNKFSPKKIPMRRCEATVLSRELGQELAAQELGLELPPIKLSLSHADLIFEEGRWIIDSNGSAHSVDKIKKKQKAAEEENNCLKLKFELLLDMLTQSTIESQLQLKQIEQLKKPAHNNKERFSKSTF